MEEEAVNGKLTIIGFMDNMKLGVVVAPINCVLWRNMEVNLDRFVNFAFSWPEV